MFQNAGAKLKGLALVIFWAFVLGGIAAAFHYRDFFDWMFDFTGLSFIVCVPLGFLIGWLSSIMLYAFAELCENVMIIAGQMYRVSGNDKNLSNIPRVFAETNSTSSKPSDKGTGFCQFCGAPMRYDSDRCEKCGRHY